MRFTNRPSPLFDEIMAAVKARGPYECEYCSALCNDSYCDACASMCPECGQREATEELKHWGGVCESCHDWQRDEDAGLHDDSDEDYEQDKNW